MRSSRTPRAVIHQYVLDTRENLNVDPGGSWHLYQTIYAYREALRKLGRQSESLATEVTTPGLPRLEGAEGGRGRGRGRGKGDPKKNDEGGGLEG